MKLGGDMKSLIKRLLALSLKKKVFMGYIVMSLTIISILGFIATGFFHIKSEYDSMNLMSDDIQLIMHIRNSIDGTRAAFLLMSLAKNPDVRAAQETVINSHIEFIDGGLQRLKGGRYGEKIIEVEKVWMPFKETLLKEIIPLIKQGRINEMMGVLGSAQTPRANVFLKITDEIIRDSRKEFSHKVDAINREIKTTITTVIVIVVAIFAVAFVFSFWFINRYVIGVLYGIRSSAEKVAKGDLTVKVESKTGDEFGKVADDVTSIIKATRHVIRDVANKTVHILKDATNLTLYGKDVSYRVDNDLERTTTAATATEEMSFTIGDIARNINVASQAAENAMNVSLKGKGMIDETVSSIDGVNTQIEMASDKVRDLSEFSKKIDNIVIMIKDIADQTNLLALNAAIEAARAGEQGRGFAVVSDEVRKLAQRTTNATAEINNILSSIHTGTIIATDMMDVAVEKVNATAAIARHLDESFAEIHSSFQRVADMVHQIVAATEEQSATVTEISTNLTNIAENAKKSSHAVKDMTASFNKFGVNAKEFLKLLDGFYDPKMKIEVTKADYVLWLHRVMDLSEDKQTLYIPAELQFDKSRMGEWYYGIGKELFGGVPVFREIEAPSRRLHEYGAKVFEASMKGDKESARQYITEAAELVNEIISLLTKLETEVG